FAQTTKDYVVLKSGDVISGKITQMNDTAVFITTGALGDLVIKKEDVQSMSFDASENPQHNTGPRSSFRPSYDMPLWYKSGGIGFNSFSADLELGRRIGTSRLRGFIKSGVLILPNYDISTLPVELGIGVYHDTTKKSDFIQMHGGYAFLLSYNTRGWYEPGMVYGLDYRHIFVNRYNPKIGTYLEVGYQGGMLKREFDNWWWGSQSSQTIERVVHRNRLRIGFGVIF
ncbi:MAG: hypothetical protein ACI8SE_001599, partial [Bacteroidia bacterium]